MPWIDPCFNNGKEIQIFSVGQLNAGQLADRLISKSHKGRSQDNTEMVIKPVRTLGECR